MISPIIYGQSNIAVVKGICDKYSSSTPFQFTSVYNLYKDHTSKVVSDSYSGIYLKKSNTEIYAKVNNTEYFVAKNLITQINHDEKVILITDNFSKPQAEFDISKLLEDFTVDKVTDMKKYWQLELKAKQFTSYPYSRIVIEAGKDYYMKRQVFYYNSAVDFSNDYTHPEIKYPRLEIVYNKPAKLISKSFSMDAYYTINQKNISASKAFKSYQIIDNRKN